MSKSECEANAFSVLQGASIALPLGSFSLFALRPFFVIRHWRLVINQMAYVDQFLQLVVRQGASDLHIAEGEPPKMRTHGDIMPIRSEAVSHDEATRILSKVATSISPTRWMNTLDFARITSNNPKGTPRHFD